MNGLGTIVNVLAIIVAGGVGVYFRGKLKPSYQQLVLEVVGAFVILIGGIQLWKSWFVTDGSQFEITGTMLIIFSLVVGVIFGEAFRLDKLLDKLGHALRRISEKAEAKEAASAARNQPNGNGNGNGNRASTVGKSASGRSGAQKTSAGGSAGESMSAKAAKRQAIREARAAASGKPLPSRREADKAVTSPAEAGSAAAVSKPPKQRVTLSELPTYDLPDTRTGHLFTDGFAIAAVICALSPVAFTGAFADGLYAETDILFTKAIMDALIVFALSTVYGSGATFAALPVLVVQGILTLVSLFAFELLTPTLMDQLTVIASIITIGAGACLCLGRRWRVVNLLPSLLISPIYGLAMHFVEKTIDK